MPEKPVAKLALDTRAHGPYLCGYCNEENEDALLMTDGSVACTHCKKPMPEFEPFSDVIVSAAPISQGRKAKKRRWAIRWESPDSSQEGTTAYDDMDEALDAACSWIEDQVKNDLMDTRATKDDPRGARGGEARWTEQDQELLELLERIEQHLQDKRYVDAVDDWLEYQSEVDPQERIEIGPSGDVTDSSMDFRRSVEAESK